jgi:hypothetical protein
MAADRRTLTWLSWALVVLTVISGAVLLLIASGVLLTPVDIPDLVDRLVAIRTDLDRLLPLIIIGGLATLGVYLTASTVGVVLRAWAAPGSMRDVMTLLLVIGGVIGIGSQLMHIGIHDAARPFYCDCGYRAEEVIGLDTALHVGETMFTWLTTGALSFVAAGVALAGRLVAVSATWRMVSYAIAIGLLVAVLIRFVAALVFIEAFDPFQVSDVIIGIVSAILIPIWAILLARGAGESEGEGKAGPEPEPESEPVAPAI